MCRPHAQRGTVQKNKSPTLTGGIGCGTGVLVPSDCAGSENVEQPEIKTDVKIKPLRVVELFAGIGQQAAQLERIGFPFISVVSEIDPKAYKAYCQVHGSTENLGDIRKIEHLPECDLLTYSFPCQDLSVQGLKNGMAEGSGTRSSLLWEVERLLRDAKERERLPEILLMENVDQILFKDNKPYLEKFIIRLNQLGYTSSYKILNQANYGIPQNRKRCFMISTLNKGTFVFPEETELKVRLRDFLEPALNVSEEYFLSPDRIKKYKEHRKRQVEKNRSFGWAPIDRNQTRNTGNFIIEEPNRLTEIGIMTDQNYDLGSRVYSTSVQNTLTTKGNVSLYDVSDDNLRIRYLTPRECFRLMGQNDRDIDKIIEQCPQKTVLYRLAGNSIVVNVLVAIFKGIYFDHSFKPAEPKQTGLDEWII